MLFFVRKLNWWHHRAQGCCLIILRTFCLKLLFSFLPFYSSGEQNAFFGKKKVDGFVFLCARFELSRSHPRILSWSVHCGVRRALKLYDRDFSCLCVSVPLSMISVFKIWFLFPSSPLIGCCFWLVNKWAAIEINQLSTSRSLSDALKTALGPFWRILMRIKRRLLL